jgi:hypothetical protein
MAILPRLPPRGMCVRMYIHGTRGGCVGEHCVPQIDIYKCTITPVRPGPDLRGCCLVHTVWRTRSYVCCVVGGLPARSCDRWQNPLGVVVQTRGVRCSRMNLWWHASGGEGRAELALWCGWCRADLMFRFSFSFLFSSEKTWVLLRLKNMICKERLWSTNACGVKPHTTFV